MTVVIEKRGHHNLWKIPANKTDPEKAKLIRQDFRSGSTVASLAKRYDVSWKTARRITEDIELKPKSELTNLEINYLLMRWPAVG